MRHNVCHRATWSVPGAVQRMSPGDLERAWCSTTYVTGRLGACLVRHTGRLGACLVRYNVCHRATWSVPGAAQRMSPGDVERAWCGTTYVTGRLGGCLVRHNVCHWATWRVPGAAQRMSPGDLERAWCGTTYVTGRLGACLVRHNVCHRATWSVPGVAQRMSPGDVERAWCGTTYVTGRRGACLVWHNVCHRATCLGVTQLFPRQYAPNFCPSITHSICFDGKHVAGPSGAVCPGVDSVDVPLVISPSSLPRVIKIPPIYTS